MYRIPMSPLMFLVRNESGQAVQSALLCPEAAGVLPFSFFLLSLLSSRHSSQHHLAREMGIRLRRHQYHSTKGPFTLLVLVTWWHQRYCRKMIRPTECHKAGSTMYCSTVHRLRYKHSVPPTARDAKLGVIIVSLDTVWCGYST